MKIRLFQILVSFLFMSISVTLQAYQNLPVTGVMPDVVHLKKDCSSTNTDLKNCASTMSEMLSWTWDTRLPDINSPLLIMIGPGDFSQFTCVGAGHVTLRGSGKNITKIKSNTLFASAMKLTNCTNMKFENLTFI